MFNRDCFFLHCALYGVAAAAAAVAAALLHVL